MLNCKLISYNLLIFLCTGVSIFSYKCFLRLHVIKGRNPLYYYKQCSRERNWDVCTVQRSLTKRLNSMSFDGIFIFQKEKFLLHAGRTLFLFILNNIFILFVSFYFIIFIIIILLFIYDNNVPKDLILN